MSNIRDFKSIADECMNDVRVSKELKDKTLMCCQKKGNIKVNRFLVPAACFMLILATVGVLDLLPPKAGTCQEIVTEPNIMAATGNAMEMFPEQSNGDIPSDSSSGAFESRPVANLDEAEKIFGSGTYIGELGCQDSCFNEVINMIIKLIKELTDQINFRKF